MTQPIHHQFNGEIRSIFPENEKWTFLVGAGISMDAPANLPSAREITRVILEFCAPSEEIETILAQNMLRYELIVEVLQQLYDTELIFMDYFDLIRFPNLNHLFLAAAMLEKHCVITTNFDYLIEYGLMKLLPSEHYPYILPVITKEDYRQYKEPFPLMDKGYYPLYKIHGSKQNIVTQELTIDSLVTTISDLGKDRKQGETFAIEPYKKPAVNNLMRNRSLLVMGYSGSDDFDIGPVLKELPHLHSLVWIEHTSSSTPEVFQIAQHSDPSVWQTLPKPLNLLMEIRSDVEFEVYLIKGSTQKIIQQLIWSSIIKKTSLIQPTSPPTAQIPPSFQKWAQQIYGTTDITTKYLLAMMLYESLNQFQSVIRVAEQGIKIAQQTKGNDKTQEVLASFYNYLALAHKDIGDLDKSREYYEKCLEIQENLEDFEGIAAAYSGFAYLYLNQGNLPKAIEYYKRCLQIAEEHHLEDHKINYITSYASVLMQQGKYEEALTLQQSALKSAEQRGDLSQKAIIYSNIGRILKIQKQYDTALANYTLALQINRELGQSRAVGTRLNLIGEIYYMQGRLDEALEKYSASVEIYEELNDLSNKARSLGNIALIYNQRKEYDKALQIFDETLKLADKLHEMPGKAIRLNNIGTIFQDQENHPKALEFFYRALQIDRELNLKDRIATDLNNIGLSYHALNQWDQSRVAFEEATSIVEEIGHDELKDVIKVNLRELYEKMGDQCKEEQNYPQAAEFYHMAYLIENERHHAENQAYYLHMEGKAYYYGDDNDIALPLFMNAIEIAKEHDFFKKLSDNWYYVALINKEGGDLLNSLDSFLNSLEFAQRANLEEDIPLLFGKIAGIYQEQGDIENLIKYKKLKAQWDSKSCEDAETAQTIITQWIEITNLYTQVKNHKQIVISLQNAFNLAKTFMLWNEMADLGYALGFQTELKLKDYDKAIELYTDTIKITQQQNIPDLEEKLNFQLARVFKSQKRIEESKHHIQKSIEYLITTDHPKRLALRWNFLGNLYYQERNYDKAIENYEKAKKLFSQIGNTENVTTMESNIERAETKKRQ